MHTHSHIHPRVYTHTYVHTSSPHLSQLMSYFSFWLSGFSAFPLSVSLYPHRELPHRRLSPCSSSTSVPFSPHCRYQFSTSFFPSIFLCPLSPYLSLSAPLLPLLPLARLFFSFFFSPCARLFPYPAGNNALPLPPIPLSFIVTSLFLHLLSSPVALISTQNRIQEPKRSRT